MNLPTVVLGSVQTEEDLDRVLNEASVVVANLRGVTELNATNTRHLNASRTATNTIEALLPVTNTNNNVVGSLQVVNTTLDTVEPSFPVDNTNTPNDTSKDPLPVANNITINSIEATVQAVIEAPVQAVTTNSHY